MIKIKVAPNKLGHIHVFPVSQVVAKRVSGSNAYDRSSDIYLQSDQEINEFLNCLSSKQKAEINKGFSIVKLFDEWDYRHMVGGQSD